MAPAGLVRTCLLLVLPTLCIAASCQHLQTLGASQTFVCLGRPEGRVVAFKIPQQLRSERWRVSADCVTSSTLARVVLGFGERYRGALVRPGEDLICDGLKKRSDGLGQQHWLYLTVVMNDAGMDDMVTCWVNVRPEEPLERVKNTTLGGNPLAVQSAEALLLPFRVRADNGNTTVLHFLGSKKGPTVRTYIFPQDHICLAELAKRGCFPATQLVECISRTNEQSRGRRKVDSNRSAMTLTWTNLTTVSLGAHSKKATDNLWYVLLSCNDRWACRHKQPRWLTMHIEQRPDAASTVALGAAFMVATPLWALLVVALLRVLLNRCTGWIERAEPRKRLGWWGTIVGLIDLASTGVQEVVFDKRPWQLAKGLLLMALAFFSSTTQFVISRWRRMLMSGDRDICWYNEACYLPLWGLDLPVNKMLSHLPYFCCSGGLFLAVLYGELKCRRHARPGVPAPDLSIFYALALSVGLEGVGSICYHLCPGLEVFQFDTAFMIPIAHLSMFALAAVSNSLPARPQAFSGMGTSVSAGTFLQVQEESTGVPTPYQYFAFCICPLWLFNFLGTGYDVEEKRSRRQTQPGGPDQGPAARLGKRYWFFALVVLIWSWRVVGGLRRLLPPGAPRWLFPALATVLRCTIIVAVVHPPTRVEHFGGFANLLLVLSILTMFLVTIVQIAVLDGHTAGAGDTLKKRMARLAIRYSFEALCFVAGNLAIRMFTTRATDVLETPYYSRAMNKSCMLLNAFDTHDLWHLLSAIALQLWVMCLLNTRLRVWKAQQPCGS